MSKDETRTGGKTGIKLALALALMSVLGVAAGFGTWSAFSSTTSNEGNSFAAGTVVISDNDGGGNSPMLSFSAATPGTSDTSCIQVSYAGTVASTVRLYGATTGTGLDQYLSLTVTRGSGATGFDDCTGFTADATDYDGVGPNGNGVIYSGTLQGFADNYDTGLIDPNTATPESWTTSESHVYQFVVTVLNDNAAQGKTATQTFTWEARNS